MMQNPLDPRDATETPVAEPRAGAQAEPATTDREVPVDARELPPAMHAFLDGERVSETALAGAEQELELWKRIGAETGRRRRMATPSHIPAQILAKLSDD